MDTEPNSDPIQPNDPLGLIGWAVGGKYKIISHLGGGGFGEVYEGHNVNLPEQRLVIKFFKRVVARDKFVKEARILCMLDHPNISHVIDFLQEEGALVVAFIDGKDCGQLLRSDGILDEKLFLSVSKSIASAVAYAHERQIAHRDIKPDNIMIDKNNHAYLIDFGIAKQIGGDATRTGYQALTPMFAAPERQQGDVDYNPYLSDVYELGVSFFNMVTRTMPYRNPVSPDIDEWGGLAAAKINPHLRQILRKATDPDPSRRYQDVKSMAADLDNITAVYSTGSTGRKIVFSVLALAVVAAGYFGYQAYQDGYFAPASSTEQTTREMPAVTTPESPVVESVDSQTPTVVESAAIDTTTQSQEIAEEPTKETAAAVTPAVEDQPAAREPEPDPPPPPLKPKLRIGVTPAESAQLYVDGNIRSIGGTFETSEGSHSVEIIHPDYPIHNKTIRVAGELTQDSIDLSQINAGSDSLSIGLSWNPYADNVMVNFTMNDGLRRFSRLPVLDLKKPTGLWQIDISMVPTNNEIAAIVVDSFKTFPYGGGPSQLIQGNSGRLELVSLRDANNNLLTIPLQIYWSEK